MIEEVTSIFGSPFSIPPQGAIQKSRSVRPWACGHAVIVPEKIGVNPNWAEKARATGRPLASLVIKDKVRIYDYLDRWMIDTRPPRIGS